MKQKGNLIRNSDRI